MKENRIMQIFLLSILSIVLKILSVYSVLVHDIWLELFKIEFLNYAVNALLLWTVFATCAKRMQSMSLRITAALLMTVVFTLQLMAENYFLQYIEFNQHFYRQPPCPYMLFVRDGLRRYFRYGYPNYHWAVLGMLSAGLLTVYEKKLRTLLKKVLIKVNEQLRLTQLYDFILTHLSDCLTRREYLRIRRAYLMELSITYACVKASRFDALDARFNCVNEEGE